MLSCLCGIECSQESLFLCSLSRPYSLRYSSFTNMMSKAELKMSDLAGRYIPETRREGTMREERR